MSSGTLVFPIGIFITYIIGNELKYAVESGYRKVLKYFKSLKLGDMKPIFKDYINNNYSKSLESIINGDPREILYKLNMNSVYGRFAMKTTSTTAHFVSINN